MKLARLLGGLLALDELGEELVRALPDLLVDDRPWDGIPDLLERLCPASTCR
ncbi:MAG: hypothetical protein M3P37_14260 [Actinomycetota bacterium]|nr:hypothetical protein [Actinomycetota bacterium]